MVDEPVAFPISLCRTPYILRSPAEEADLKRCNLIKETNRVEIHTAQEFEKTIAGLKSGDSAAMLVRRGQNTFFVAIEIQ